MTKPQVESDYIAVAATALAACGEGADCCGGDGAWCGCLGSSVRHTSFAGGSSFASGQQILAVFNPVAETQDAAGNMGGRDIARFRSTPAW